MTFQKSFSIRGYEPFLLENLNANIWTIVISKRKQATLVYSVTIKFKSKLFSSLHWCLMNLAT